MKEGKVLLCKKNCYYKGDTEDCRPFVIKGNLYKIINLNDSLVSFKSECNPYHLWDLDDPEFQEYLELVEDPCDKYERGLAAADKVIAADIKSLEEDTSTQHERNLEGLGEAIAEGLSDPTNYERPKERFVMEDDSPYGLIAAEAEECKKEDAEWTDKHYDFKYQLTELDEARGFIKVDAYFVNRIWKLNSWDDTGAAFHNLKTFTRIGNNKNTLQRELKALLKQTQMLCKLHGVEL